MPLPLAAPPLPSTPVVLSAVAAVVLGGALLARRLIQQHTHRGRIERRAGTPAVWVASLAAIGCTAYSADTSWRFAADYLDMGSTVERAAMFAAAEFALFATALLARQNLHGPRQAPGLPAILTWAITAVQILPAYAESGPVGGTVRAFVGPVMAALLWHQAMGIELRHRRPEATSHSLIARAGREIRERALSRLGLAERDRDAAQITRDRATRQAVALAARHSERSPKQRGSWRGRRAARRLSRAVARAQVGSDPRQRQELLHQLAARRHAKALATIDLPSPWTDLTAATSSADAHSREADEGRRSGDGAREDSSPEQETTDPVPPLPEQAGATPRRTGRPPDATHEELLAIGRTVVARMGEVSRKAIVEEIRENRGLKASNARLKNVVDALEAEFENGPDLGKSTS
ncbi:hypothetical protein [Streptomyces sp. XD-27]|uniref:hypothetical protein n=1 Tax=Streptomyces sp. XD-27 TaxID=3062779 RepID=UPI0026F414AA|nr:hypothetical protein [Streptomyces sp. XD-27]WKX72173.1 hypothetical protein Q3Y56_21725 [Streptomyces sp. XD-27]